jgi:hypothetical protein
VPRTADGYFAFSQGAAQTSVGRGREDLAADISTAEAQLQRSKPDPTVMDRCLPSIQNVLEGAVATGLAARAPEHLAMMMAALR